jgi:ABC-2 type transport system ATP-binding protein
MLEALSIRKTYRTVRAVDGLSFKARPGEVFGLIGPNGAGKSTTIRMVMGIIAPDSGELRFEGRAMGDTSRSRIGYLPEERGMYRKAKVGELLRYFAALKGAPPAAASARIRGWLERFDLGEWEGRKVEELSKGMAQKVQFIGSIAHEPDLVLFDEPFAGLDPVSQDLILEAMLDLKSSGKTVLVSTHVMEHAEKLCDRILMIDRGKEVTSGTLAEVKTRHGSDTVQVECDGDAAFVGALPCVAKVALWPRAFEARLAAGAEPDELYRALSGRLKVRRFEVLAPSLHSIFVELAARGVAAADAKTATEGAEP